MKKLKKFKQNVRISFDRQSKQMTNEMVVMYFFDLTSYSLDSIYKS